MKPAFTTFDMAVQEAIGLRPDTVGENPEYMRGMCELLARCFPSDTDTSTRAEEIQGLVETGKVRPHESDPLTDRAELVVLRQDAERFAAIANLDHVAINKWLVQAMTKESYQTAYFKAPAGVVPNVLHASKLEALRFAIDAAIAQAAQP